MSQRSEGRNEETVKRELVEGAEKLHQWPPEVGLGYDVSALNLYQKAQLQRSYRKWPPLDLIELARVCKLIVLVDREFELLNNEGLTVAGGRNGTTLVANPRAAGIATVNGTINNMLRRLGIAATSINDKRSTLAEAEVEREMRENNASLQTAKGDAVGDDALLN